MINVIKQNILRIILKVQVKKVRIARSCIIKRTNYYEGNNAIYSGTEFTDSYLGYGSYIANNSVIRKTKIGRYCAIGDNVRTSLGLHPVKNWVSIHPAFFSINKQAGFTHVNTQHFEEHKYTNSTKKFVVEIGNDVWIGNNVMIMDGISIGDGAIIAAGSIVTKNINAYEIVGGVPAKLIKKRFSESQIKKLLEKKWWEYKDDLIKRKAYLFKDINEFLANF